jgi:hypothetical protein
MIKFQRHQLRALLLSLLLACGGARGAFGYGRTEIANIVMTALRSEDREVRAAIELLRSRGVLELKSRTLAPLVAAVDARVAQALEVLSARGLLPDASTSVDAMEDYGDDIEAANAREDARAGQATTIKPLVLLAKTARPAPFFVQVPSQQVYILGGVAPQNAELEMIYPREAGVVEVLFATLNKGFIQRSYLQPVKLEASQFRQDPSKIQVLKKGPLTVWHAQFQDASMHVARLDLVSGGPSLVPYLTGRFNRTDPGDQQVEDIAEVARRNAALMAINGTFFIDSGPGPGYGTPLGPAIIAGREAWTYNEPRVLAMNRVFMAITTGRRVVTGETNLVTKGLLAAHHRGALLPGVLRGERIVHLLGGFGWLARNGDTALWRRYVGSQFGYSYYSHYARRPQSIVAIAEGGRRLWFIAQEGLPHSPRPLALPELVLYATVNFHAPTILFLDGGYSTELVLDGQILTRPEKYRPYRLNSTMWLVMPKGRRPSTRVATAVTDEE